MRHLVIGKSQAAYHFKRKKWLSCSVSLIEKSSYYHSNPFIVLPYLY
jgi:hypothetical protein